MIISMKLYIKKERYMHYPSLGLALRKEIVSNKTAISIVGVCCFALLTWLGAYIYIPLGFTPVPMTLQTMFVFLSGAILGRKLGAISQTTYLSMGIFGLPLFSAGGFGLLHIVGPTGGYIVGFVVASYLIGSILKDKTSTIAIATAFLAGAFVIYICGSAWLVLGFNIGFRQALLLGVLPFMPGCIIKIILATTITRLYIKRSRNIFA
jgi:biotin transport system substrate-specific component